MFIAGDLFAAMKLKNVLPDLFRARMIGYNLTVDLNMEALINAGFSPDGTLFVDRIFVWVSKSGMSLAA